MREHEAKSYMLVPTEMAQSLGAGWSAELKELGRSVESNMYIIGASVYKDCRLLCIGGTPRTIDAGLRVLMPHMQKLLRAKPKPTFLTATYMHDKSVVPIRSDFAAYLSEHASGRLQHVADATHTHIYIEDIEEMEIASPLRRLHITGAADNVKAACNRLHQVQVDFEALPSDPTRLVYTLRIVLLNRDVMSANNSRMVVTASSTFG
ncbi:hypothetical protein SDRG_00231 [Saprolegnia diclina VS20]|uniref:Uncharacterized protein n=1 Tax=Saprolegnia diclina (strain VS20) TaxID=1156394 RepID=T0SAX6_SAPDV|nr:hypothetical protein SDRG_00231 [Saprolegnia diclina VS20]EQC42498.1 hypothetical protein SDRG_00231 [Saprolegnia diclina VS20]|eukprot:XP_008603921.1 hypothetical protein SDRG_00231 [Saprolegnia diclina VS20]